VRDESRVRDDITHPPCDAWPERRDETRDETPRDETRDETTVPDGRSLRVRLIDASNGNIDALSDISPIRALLAQGCDLEADVVPVETRDRRAPVGIRGDWPMTVPNRLTAIVEALRSAGATEGIIAAAVKSGWGICELPTLSCSNQAA
jgi:hypothetical protein